MRVSRWNAMGVALLLAMAFGTATFAQNTDREGERAGGKNPMSSARTERFLGKVNPLLQHIVDDLTARYGLSDDEQGKLIGALRPAAVEAVFGGNRVNGNAWEEGVGLVRPRHLLQSEGIWKAMSPVLSPAQIAEYRKILKADFDRRDRAIAGMWVAWMDLAVGLRGEQREAVSDLLVGTMEVNDWALTPGEALSQSDEWMRLVIDRIMLAIERMSPEQQHERKPLLSPTQLKLFKLLATEEERQTDIREFGHKDTKGKNIEGRREIARAAVAAHMELLGPLEPTARKRLELASKDLVKKHLAEDDGVYRQADVAKDPRFQKTIRDVLTKPAYAAYRAAQAEREALAEMAFEELLYAFVEEYFFLLNEKQRERMRKASRNTLPTMEMESLARYVVSLVKTLPKASPGSWQQQQIDVLRRVFGSEWSED